jgi:hypothetical protein
MGHDNALLDAALRLLGWFRTDESRPLVAADLLLDGCPNELAADVSRLRAAAYATSSADDFSAAFIRATSGR